MSNISVIVPAVIPVIFALTQTKLPVKLKENMVVLKSGVGPESAISNQSSSVGVVASEPCILIVVAATTYVSILYATVCTPSGCE